jgi:GT2 family glycosyltransferase
MRDLTIIITSYRTPQLLSDCLARLREIAPEAIIYVVDAGSRDGSREIAEQFGSVSFYERPNHSMANLVNEGLMLVNTPLVLQMNADVILTHEALRGMREALQRSDVGLAGPRCHTRDGRWQHQGALYTRYHWLLDTFKKPYVSVHWLSGCCTMLRTDLLQTVGGMNSSFRFYNEDMEWSYRFRQAGYRCLLINAPVLHVGGASTPSSARFVAEGLRGGYQLSLVRYPRVICVLHLLYLRFYASLTPRLSKDPVAVDAARLISEMISRRLFFESPFGDTLNEVNPIYQTRSN